MRTALEHALAEEREAAKQGHLAVRSIITGLSDSVAQLAAGDGGDLALVVRSSDLIAQMLATTESSDESPGELPNCCAALAAAVGAAQAAWEAVAAIRAREGPLTSAEQAAELQAAVAKSRAGAAGEVAEAAEAANQDMIARLYRLQSRLASASTPLPRAANATPRPFEFATAGDPAVAKVAEAATAHANARGSNMQVRRASSFETQKQRRNNRRASSFETAATRRTTRHVWYPTDRGSPPPGAPVPPAMPLRTAASGTAPPAVPDAPPSPDAYASVLSPFCASGGGLQPSSPAAGSPPTCASESASPAPASPPRQRPSQPSPFHLRVQAQANTTTAGATADADAESAGFAEAGTAAAALAGAEAEAEGVRDRLLLLQAALAKERKAYEEVKPREDDARHFPPWAPA